MAAMMSAAKTQSRVPELATETVPELWRACVARYGDLDVIRHDGSGLTYAEADQRSAALARGLLAEGAGKGTRIGILAPNGPDWLVAWLAVNRIGALGVLISTFFAGRELAYALRHADVAILISADRYLRHDYLARLEEVFPDLPQADGARPLALANAPYLRSIWLAGRTDRRWARGSLDELAALGEASQTFTPELLQAVERNVTPADLGIIMYTSGSTSDPKGVVHTQGVEVRKTLFMTRGGGIIPANTERGDRVILTNPMFWVGGFLSAIGSMAAGATIVCVDDHSPGGILKALREERGTHITCSEAVLLSLRAWPDARPGDFDRLKQQNTDQCAFFNPDVPRAQLCFSLGMTETFGPHSGYNEGGLLPEGITGSVGPALDGVEYKITDPDTGETLPPGVSGELCVRTPWLMDGMYKKERREVFDVHGYYHTGDRCILSSEGFVYFESRLSGMIKTSGANVSPDEVETVIREIPDVIEVAVLGVPDAKVGQLVVAAVVKIAGSALDAPAVQARVRSQLSSFKVPKRVFFFNYEDLPRTPSNKVRKPPLVQVIQKLMGRSPKEPAPAGS
ncbi:MAG: hypothetical protein JWQ97_1559 [Phenylobacterium sp.]|nr:hypothetical protein [Phenylobacterium sp.]